ncbi:nucleoside hydrolase [Tilletiaria anomala UBC 951]|uniref:Nucleoside hydrolase n=1 Tax=Tilletiaria anomala (strain ATCC 24038 / CBS 436.72 / UBC 951) TaxID=1037660 RepID=A0A066WKT3_TILAU|nr:nucleoside hydrolase [Tilletiaria anomala UBC 951]KDN53188.1 nucleoside hydrolase [Tilletiaria anomala UBC 951]
MSPPRKLIIDTDPGVDDILSIVLALASEEVEIAALTLTFGNTTLDYALSNVLRLGGVLKEHLESDERPRTQELLQRSVGPSARKIPVYSGATGPLAGNAFTASYFHGRDGLSSVSFLPGDPFPEPKEDFHPFQPVDPSSKDACDAILDILAAEPPGTVYIAAVGPLTNLALAWQKDPKTFAKVGQIAVMGGALDHAGNTTPTSEFNFFADPYAAAVLLEIPRMHPSLNGQPLPIHLLPLDITHQHLVPFSQLVKSQSTLSSASPLSRFVSAFLSQPRTVMNSFAPPDAFDPQLHDNFIAHDPLAVAYAIFGSMPGWQTQERVFKMEIDGSITRGMCVIDRRGYHKSSAGENQAMKDLKQNGSIKKPLVEQDGDSSPFPIKVVVASPGSKWFADTFLSRLTL